MDKNVRRVFSIISIIGGKDGGIVVQLPAGVTHSFYSKAYRPVPDLRQARKQFALLAVPLKVK